MALSRRVVSKQGSSVQQSSTLSCLSGSADAAVPRRRSAPAQQLSSTTSTTSSLVVASSSDDILGGGRAATALQSHTTGFDTSSSPPRVASAGMAGRVRIDVLASRHASHSSLAPARGGDREGSALRMSRESVATSIASSAMSHRSVCQLERELGKALPLNKSGTHVTLSASDLAKVRDAQTLQFLRDNSELFVKYFRELHEETGDETRTADDREQQKPNDDVDVAGAVRPTESASDSDVLLRRNLKPIDAGVVAEQVKALCDEIETFITAVDYEGQSYQVQVDEHGELHVPVDVTDDATADDGSDAAADDDVNFNDEEMQAFEAAHGLAPGDGAGDWDMSGGSQVSLLDGRSDKYDNDDEVVVGDRNPFEDHAAPDRDSACSDVLMGSMASTLSPEDALRQRFDDHRKLLALTGELQLQRQLNRVVAHHKGVRPRFMGATKASAGGSGGGGGDDGTATAALPPSPPPARKPKSTQSFGVHYCGKKAGAAKPSIAALAPPSQQPKQQRVTLTSEEEARVEFLLAHENWDEMAMTPTSTTAAPSDAAAPSGPPSSSGDRPLSTASGHSRLSYDRRSTETYAPSAGGFQPDAPSVARLRSIDEQLRMLLKLRGNDQDHVDLNDDGEVDDRATCATSRPAPESVPRSLAGAHVAKSSERSAARSTKAESVTETTESELAAAKKRRALGNHYLQEYRKEKQVRAQFAAINDKLNRLSEDMDLMSTPPFSFHVRYDMGSEPSDWQWPASLQKPSEDTIVALLAEARKEATLAQREQFLRSLPSSSDGCRTSSAQEQGGAAIARLLVNGFTQKPSAALASATCDDDVADETEVAPGSYFHETLRERLQRATALVREVESAQYHGSTEPDATTADANDDEDVVDDAQEVVEGVVPPGT